jgi:hypothetical protein
MLKPAGDLGLAQEAAETAGVAVEFRLHALEGHVAVQDSVLSHKHLPEAAPGVQAHGSITTQRWHRRWRRK